MHVLLDLRTLYRLPSASRAYLLALLDSVFPALREGDQITALKRAGDVLPFRPIQHESVQYYDAVHKPRRRKGYQELNDLVQELRPDVYWSADPYLRYPVAPVGKRLYYALSLETLPPFIEMADASWRERLRWLWRAHPQLQTADVMICPNHLLAVAYVAHLGLSARHRTVVVPNGVHSLFRRYTEEEVLEVRRKWLIPKRYVLMVGETHDAESLAIPLQALAQSEEVSSITCVILGDKTLPSALRETIRDGHLEGLVRFLDEDELSLADVAAIHSGALVTFDPMRTADYRPTALRSMACGTPVICAAGALSEELYGNAVMRVRPTSPTEWAQAYTGLVLSTVLRERQIERGEKFVLERTWTATAKVSFHTLHAMCENRLDGTLGKMRA